MNDEQLKHLKKQYKIALDRNLDSFTFYGQTLLTTYAKYLIDMSIPNKIKKLYLICYNI